MSLEKEMRKFAFEADGGYDVCEGDAIAVARNYNKELINEILALRKEVATAKQYAEAMCKEQREMCALKYREHKAEEDHGDYYDSILTTPLATNGGEE